MKRIFLLIIAVASTVHLFAQVQKSDTVRECNNADNHHD